MPTPSLISSTFPSSLPKFSPLPKTHLSSPFLKASFIPKSSSSLLSISAPTSPPSTSKPSPAEISRTIMELSSFGTLSTLTHVDNWPVGTGAQFVVDADGSPALCLKDPGRVLDLDARSSFHVQLEQSRSRMVQCTVLGSLKKPDDGFLLKKVCAKWEKKFGEEVDRELVYVISVEKVLQIGDFKEEGVWVASSEYQNAQPDPLRNCVEKIVDEMNSEHAGDVLRLCKVHVDSEFQLTDIKIIWVDRLGFDLYMHSDQGIFAARIPFPREVTDEKGVKSLFNSMSHLAWEIEKNYIVPDFQKVKCVKIR